MKTGEKIRNVRTLKGLSQENMAEMLGMSLRAYGDIERGQSELSTTRLGQIADTFGMSVDDLLAFNDRVTNFFDQCHGAIGLNNGTVNYDQRELQHQVEKLSLENQLLKLAAEKAEIEAK